MIQTKVFALSHKLHATFKDLVEVTHFVGEIMKAQEV